MKNLTCAIGVLLLATTTASAEPDPLRISVRGGAEIGGYNGDDIYGGLTLEGDFRLGTLPLFARARVGKGIGFRDRDTSMDYMDARLGLEYRQRLGVDWLHAYGGVDVGVIAATYTDLMTHVAIDDSAAIAIVPRAGLQIGNRVYGRLGVEMPLLLPDAGTELGFAVTAGFGAAF